MNDEPLTILGFPVVEVTDEQPKAMGLGQGEGMLFGGLEDYVVKMRPGERYMEALSRQLASRRRRLESDPTA